MSAKGPLYQEEYEEMVLGVDFPSNQQHHLSLELAAYLPWPSARWTLVCSGHSIHPGSGSHLHKQVLSHASGDPAARGEERLGILSIQRSSRNTWIYLKEI